MVSCGETIPLGDLQDSGGRRPDHGPRAAGAGMRGRRRRRSGSLLGGVGFPSVDAQDLIQAVSSASGSGRDHKPGEESIRCCSASSRPRRPVWTSTHRWYRSVVGDVYGLDVPLRTPSRGCPGGVSGRPVDRNHHPLSHRRSTPAKRAVSAPVQTAAQTGPTRLTTPPTAASSTPNPVPKGATMPETNTEEPAAPAWTTGQGNWVPGHAAGTIGQLPSPSSSRSDPA